MVTLNYVLQISHWIAASYSKFSCDRQVWKYCIYSNLQNTPTSENGMIVLVWIRAQHSSRNLQFWDTFARKTSFSSVLNKHLLHRRKMKMVMTIVSLACVLVISLLDNEVRCESASSDVSTKDVDLYSPEYLLSLGQTLNSPLLS